MYLLEDPDKVHEDSFTVFASALWFYMTPQSPKPSIHDVTTGFFVPNAVDEGEGRLGGFGTTTNIINGGFECGTGFETAKSANRVKYYKALLDFFNVETTQEEETAMNCGGEKKFGANGTGAAPSYFAKVWDNTPKCQVVAHWTPYSVYARDDYKRCVCDTYGDKDGLNKGASACPNASSEEAAEE